MRFCNSLGRDGSSPVDWRIGHSRTAWISEIKNTCTPEHGGFDLVSEKENNEEDIDTKF
jgi:hypothetical protein